MSAVVRAIPTTAELTGRPVVVIGGLAVLCRLSTPYRVTSDLDAVDRHAPHEVGQPQLLLDSGATKSTHAAGAMVPTSEGPVEVDVLEVKDSDLDLLDIVRLTFDPICRPTALEELANASKQLQRDAEHYVTQWFGDLSAKTLQCIHRVPEGRDILPDDLKFVEELLGGALRGRL
jgi:hypothetical protein